MMMTTADLCGQKRPLGLTSLRSVDFFDFDGLHILSVKTVDKRLDDAINRLYTRRIVYGRCLAAVGCRSIGERERKSWLKVSNDALRQSVPKKGFSRFDWPVKMALFGIFVWLPLSIETFITVRRH